MAQQSAALAPTAPSATWDEDEWAEKIAKDNLLLETVKEIQAAVAAFEKKATRQEADELASIRSWFQETHALATQKHDQKQGTSGAKVSFRQRFRKARSATSATVLQYCEHVDFIAGVCPNYVQAVWGSVRLLLVAETNHSKLRSSVEQHLVGLSTKFALIETLTVYVPTSQMVTSLVSAYSAYARFLEKAVKYYSENRFKTSLNAFARPWEQRFQPAVDNVIEAIANVLQVGQVFSIGTLSKILRVAERLEHLIDGEYIRLSDPSMTQQTHEVLQDRLHERISEQNLTTPQLRAPYTLDNTPLGSMKDLFPSLAEIEKHAQACQSVSEHFMSEEDSKQMFSSTQNVDKIMSWLEAETSQVMWIDGGSQLSNLEWNSRFALPVLRDLRNNFRSVSIVRYFAAEYGRSNPSNDSRTLVQSFLAQLLSNHQSSLSSLDRERLRSAQSNFTLLWDIFLECLDTIGLQCIVIVIDSIDSLYDKVSATQVSDIEMLVVKLNDLAASSSVTAKILLTTNFEPVSNLAALKQSKTLVLARPSGSSDSNGANSHNRLVTLKLQEIATDQCQKISFLSVYLLYFPDTVVFVGEGDRQQCYIVAELSGMQPLGAGKYGPLTLRCRYINHDKTSLCFAYREFKIHQFLGEKAITELECIPSGWLSNEAERREILIERGVKFWDFAYGIHYQILWPDQPSESGKRYELNRPPDAQRKVMIDQKRAETLFTYAETSSQSTDDKDDRGPTRVEYTHMPGVLLLLICSAQIPGYVFDKQKWELTYVANLAPAYGSTRRLNDIVVDANIYKTCDALITQRSRIKPSDAQTSIWVLLHGPPNVGKSSLIGAICESKSVPFMKVDANNFGSQTLELAVAWAAIVLVVDPENVRWLNTKFPDSLKPFSNNWTTHPAVVFFTTSNLDSLHRQFIDTVDLALQFPRLSSLSYSKIWKEQILRLTDIVGARDWFHEEIWETLKANFGENNLSSRQVTQLANTLYFICAPQLTDPDLTENERLDIIIGELNHLCTSQLELRKAVGIKSGDIPSTTRVTPTTQLG